MPAVRIESEAFADERYTTLARLAGLADADHARGKMARLWRQCTEQATSILPVEIVESVLGANASDALTKSRLGEVVHDGIRICGTDGRIGWYKKNRKNGKKGGEAKAKRMLSERLAGLELEIEIEISPESLSAADKLRNAIVAKQPGHQLAKSWSTATRNRWARELEGLHRKQGRTWVDIDLVVSWLFYEQPENCGFVVQSPKALADKWDRIEAVRSRQKSSTAQTTQPQRSFNRL